MLDSLQQLLIENGALGMFLAAFLAGSFLPFSSEVVMIALLTAGTPATELLIWGTLGNVLGALFNYFIGSLGKEEWIQQWTKVSPEKLEKGKQKVRKYGSWAGLLAWIPILGSVITVAMGYLRTNLLYSVFNIAVGKFARYAILISAYKAL
jgi:putative inner membrane protein